MNKNPKVNFFQKLHELGFSSYDEYLQSPHWKDVRVRYWASRMPKSCKGCGRKDGLELHHRTYKRLGNEWLQDLIPFCRNCHQRTHDEEKLIKEHIKNKSNKVGVNPLWTATKQIVRKYNKEKKRGYKGFKPG